MKGSSAGSSQALSHAAVQAGKADKGQLGELLRGFNKYLDRVSLSRIRSPSVTRRHSICRAIWLDVELPNVDQPMTN